MISYLKRNKILVTGGSGRFGKILIKKNFNNFIFRPKTTRYNADFINREIY